MLALLGFPRVGEHRRFVTAIVADTVGSGLFMPITLLYFVALTDLSLVEIGAALSISALCAIPTSFVVGSWVDRFGARRVMLAGNLAQAVGMVAYLWADSFAEVAAWSVLLTVGRQAFWGSYGPVVTAITRPGERETWFGFLQALRNLGYALGGLVAGAALQVDSPVAFRAIVVANAVMFVVAFVLLLGVPDHHRAEVAKEEDAHHLPRGARGWGVVLRDGPYLRLVAAQLAFSFGVMVLNHALPVYVAETLDLPGWTVGAIFTLNAVMVGLGQGLVVRWMAGRRRARMMALAQLVFVASYAVFVVVGLLPAGVAVVAVLLGAVVYTFGELLGGPVLNATAAEAAPAHLRGRYLSLGQLSWGVTGAAAPVAFTWLLTHGTFSVWAVLAGVALLGAAGTVRLPAVLPAAGLLVSDASRTSVDGPETADVAES